MTFEPVRSRRANYAPLACVMGGMDLVRPIGCAGIRCAVVARPGSPALYSRFTDATLTRDDFFAHDEALVDELVRFGAAQAEPPVLFYEEDAQLLLVSRHRDRLARVFRFVIAAPDLVESLVDKSRFAMLAAQVGLPVPATRVLEPAAAVPALDLSFPVVVKPLMRTPTWDRAAQSHKALELETPAELRALWPSLAGSGQTLLAQEFVPGPETAIESYHVYVDRTGSVAADFTGRKIRTWPTRCGHSTALEISDAADVKQKGRAAVERLALTGVAKLDFKRAPDGRLHLLEVNPRFNLWHHLGAVAGVDIPSIVYADLAGRPRPRRRAARVGARWCSIEKDLPAARASGLPLTQWLPWMLGCDAKSAAAWDDPMPLVRNLVYRIRARGRAGGTAALQLTRQAG